MIHHELNIGGSGMGLSYYDSFMKGCQKRAGIQAQMKQEAKLKNPAALPDTSFGIARGTIFHAFANIWLNSAEEKINVDDVAFSPLGHPALRIPSNPKAWIPLNEAKRVFNWFQGRFSKKLFGEILAVERHVDLMAHFGWDEYACIEKGVPPTGDHDLVVQLDDPTATWLGVQVPGLHDLSKGRYIIDWKVLTDDETAAYPFSRQATAYCAQDDLLRKINEPSLSGFIFMAIITGRSKTKDDFYMKGIKLDTPRLLQRQQLLHYLKAAYRNKTERAHETNAYDCMDWKGDSICPAHPMRGGDCWGF